jgi:hypothetical protein
LKAQVVLDFIITQNSNPLNLNIGSDTSINLGQEITLGKIPLVTGGTSPYVYSWSPSNSLDNPSLANPIAKPLVDTYYKVLVSDSKGCVKSDSIEVSIIFPTGISQIEFHQNFNIYPNPNKGVFTISANPNSKKVVKTLEIFDPLGRLIYVEDIENVSTKFDRLIVLDLASPGIFNIKIITQDSILVSKFIVE